MNVPNPVHIRRSLHIRRAPTECEESGEFEPGSVPPSVGGGKQVPDAAGEAGDIAWNFEKFLVGPGGEVLGRFRPQTDPEATEIVEMIEANLPG